MSATYVDFMSHFAFSTDLDMFCINFCVKIKLSARTHLKCSLWIWRLFTEGREYVNDDARPVRLSTSTTYDR